MERLPEEVLTKIRDFRFGSKTDWKTSFKDVINEMDNWFYYFKEVCEYVEYMDINDDEEN